MHTVALIQARMGSTRLPGKVMLSLDCTPVIEHVVDRVSAAKEVDVVVVATTKKDRDDLVERYARRAGAAVFRGSEEDVLGRMYATALRHDAEVVVRLTSDNPLVSPTTIDESVRILRAEEVDYVSNKVDPSFPSGLDVETFTFGSFERVEAEAETEYDREHVTPYYRESGLFNCRNLSSEEVFHESFMQDRTDLRLTLDTPDDFELFARIYDEVEYDDVLDVRDAVRFLERRELVDYNIG